MPAREIILRGFGTHKEIVFKDHEPAPTTPIVARVLDWLNENEPEAFWTAIASYR